MNDQNLVSMQTELPAWLAGEITLLLALLPVNAVISNIHHYNDERSMFNYMFNFLIRAYLFWYSNVRNDEIRIDFATFQFRSISTTKRA